MHVRTAALLGFVLLVALAGCNALGPSGSSGEFEGVAYPDGTGPDGVTNASALLQTHQSALAEDSYRIAFNATYAEARGTGETKTIIASNETQNRQLLNATVQGRPIGQYLNGTHMISRTQNASGMTYDTQPIGGSIEPFHQDEAGPNDLLRTVVSAGDFRPNRTGSVDGVETITFRATDHVANASGQVPDEIQRFNATIRVDADGRIRWAELFVTGQDGGRDVVYYQEFRALEVGGVQVERPAWVDEATA